VHGADQLHDLAALPGPVADDDWYRISQKPYSSYEVVVEATSGDVGATLNLDRIASDTTTVQQAAVSLGVGYSRSLRWMNASASAVNDEYVRVTSGQCTTGCGPDDVYRIRVYETTYAIPRFNNAGSQVTVLILQNPTDYTVTGNIYFWSTVGALLATEPFSLTAKSARVLITSTVSGASGVSGTMTVAHNARYCDLAGKTVALEPATGFSFDTPSVNIPY
jgi:hypothetical protein